MAFVDVRLIKDARPSLLLHYQQPNQRMQAVKKLWLRKRERRHRNCSWRSRCRERSSSLRHIQQRSWQLFCRKCDDIFLMATECRDKETVHKVRNAHFDERSSLSIHSFTHKLHILPHNMIFLMVKTHSKALYVTNDMSLGTNRQYFFHDVTKKWFAIQIFPKYAF